jgi:hypothetical protein
MKLEIDTSRFDRVMKQYLRYSSRSYAEACDQHAYYIARNATNTTKTADPNVIRAALNVKSKMYDASLASILVNWKRGKQGKKGLTGDKMVSAVEKLIKTYINHRNFLRAGWIPAIKRLALVVPRRGGSPIPPATAKKGREFGGAQAASPYSSKPFALIWNSSANNKKREASTKRSVGYLEEGLRAAMRDEVRSMIKYIRNKQMQAKSKFWS